MLLCSQHKLPLTHICGLSKCRAIFCTSCLAHHFSQTNHNTYVLFNQRSLSFFLLYCQQIIVQIDHIILAAQKTDLAQAISPIRTQQTALLARQYSNKIAEAFEREKQLLMKNRAFVYQNQTSLENLVHPLFFEDIFTFITNKWEVKAQDLLKALIREIGCVAPPQVFLASLCSALVQGPSSYLEKRRQEFLEKQSNSVIYLYQQRPASLQLLKQQSQPQQKGNSFHAKIQQGVLSKAAESFYEILEDQRVQPSFSNDCQNNLQNISENSSSIRANFLSYEELERQIQQTLMENQRLRMINTELKRQNQLLKQENAELRSRLR